MNEGSLAAKRALVVGAGGGLGSAIAASLARAGCAVALAGRDLAQLAPLADRIGQAAGVRTLPIRIDLGASGSIAGGVGDAVAALGGLDVLVNAAGRVANGSFEQVSAREWVESIEVKLLGTLDVIRNALPHLKRAQGTVITLTGLYGKEPSPLQIVSGAINAALANSHKALATDLAPSGVRVVSLCLGGFLTDRLRTIVEQAARESGRGTDDELRIRQQGLPMRRYGAPEELGELVAFLASSRCRYLDGAALVVDGSAAASV
ncbi:MAG: SDR family oxidoreductase [Lautropia sp.]